MLIGTAGHIDHGKTALIKALTGVDTDRLKEEKARGITIDLGYAFYPLRNGETLGFIDVPGHERFVHNMLAGATGIDAVLLMVATDDGVMPQTREHLEILDLLGISRGAVALTKVDRAETARALQVQTETAQLLRGTALAGSPIFPVSSVTGEGIAHLRTYLEALAAETPVRAGNGHFRLAVDRCFTLAGSGTVVTGTVFSGSVRVGDKLLVSPRGLEVRVRGVHAQNRETAESYTGQRCALNLAGIEKQDVARGDWVLEPAAHAPTTRFDARLQLMPGARPLKHWTPVHVHLGAADVMGRVSLLVGTSIPPGGSGLAQIVLDQPIGALHGDRFILRDQAARFTLAGGRVLDPFAPARKARTPERLAVLAALQTPLVAQTLPVLLQEATGGVDLSWFERSHNLRAAAAATLYREVPMTVITGAGGAFGFASARWDALKQSVLDVLASEHKRAPELLGLDAKRLRRLAAPQLSWELYSVLIEQLLGVRSVARHGPWLHLPNHRIALTPAEEKLWRMIAPLLRAKLFQPPWVRDIAGTLKVPEPQVRALLERITLLGEAYEVLHDRFFAHEAITALAHVASELDRAQGAVDAAMFRDRIGTGRKLAIQILEYFDKTGFSRRIGDARRVRDATLLVDGVRPSGADKSTAGAATISGRDALPGGAA